MVVFVLETASESIRGRISLWCLEVKPGVFVGNLTKTVREKIWEEITSESSYTGALMIWNTNNEQGIDIDMTLVPTRKVIDLDGIKLILRDTQSQ